MLLKDHYALSPPSDNCTLWRYMDFTKLLSLLESKELFFTRADKFEDPFEGSHSAAGLKLLKNPSTNGGLPETAVDQLVKYGEQAREEMFISCWHMNEHESAAMWKLYLKSDEGIALRTDYWSLRDVLDSSPVECGISKVDYIDYDSHPIRFDNAYFPFVHKRMSFAHEQELRAIVWSGSSEIKKQFGGKPSSVSIGVSLDRLVKAIHVSPTAPAWFGDLVTRVLSTYGLSVNVEKSNLYNRPIV